MKKTLLIGLMASMIFFLILGTAYGEYDDGRDVEVAVEIIDNAVYVDDADWTDGTSSHSLIGGIYQGTPQTITSGDTGPIQVDANGNVITSSGAGILLDTADIETAVEILDNVVGTHDSATPTQVSMQGQYAETTVPAAVADGDVVRPNFNEYGEQRMAGYNPATGAVQVELVSAPPVEDGCTAIVDGAVLNSNGETATGEIYIGDANKITMYMEDTETVVTDNSQADGVLSLSPDGSSYWLATTVVINSEDNAAMAAGDWTLDSNEERFMWFPAGTAITHDKPFVTKRKIS